ncbi:Ubiquitin-specific protease [Phytophthora cinnamomi]|uniref:Ubiquitin-specific protease n=1 Tax=Phytophthora cinnamomi TaxID=4785 RepID=UPI00355A7172|nr:Ubiquitin-specific protease [Phytophthora cinnamomi]
MTKDAPHCCEGDDWLVVGSDDGSRGPAAGGSPRSKDSSEAHAGLEASQPPNQIEPQQAPLESDSNQKEQHQDRSLFQLLVWHNGLEVPVELPGENQKPLVVAASASSSTADLQRMLQELVLVHPQLRAAFPQVERSNVADMIQVCQRSDESEAWVPLAILADAEREDSCGAKLQLTSQIDLSAQMMWRQLLVECKFEAATCSDELTAWRHGRFFSYIQANAWRFELYLDQLVDALDTDKRWYESRIVDMDAVYVKVHYRGWTSKWDEWLRRTSARLAPLHTKVPNWRAFQVGDRVMVGTEIGKRYPEWRNAQVTACDSEGDLLQIEVDVDGKKKWMDSQDELLCPTGTHKAVNADARVVSAVLAAPPSLLFNYFERPGESASSVPRNDQSEGLELESIRQATHAMHLADSDGDGDEWCVVDDDRDEDSADAETNTDNNQTEGIVDEDDTTISEGSASCGVDPATSNSAPPTTNAAFSTLDQMFATTTEVLHGPIEATVGEEDTWRYQLQIDQLIDARDTDNVRITRCGLEFNAD